MLMDLFGWRIRWRGEAASGGYTIHVGTDRSYVAVYMEKDANREPRRYSKSKPLNHIGVEVDDLDALGGVSAPAVALKYCFSLNPKKFAKMEFGNNLILVL